MSYYEKEQARLLRLLAEYEAEEEDGGELLSSEESDADENVSEQDVQCDMDIEEEVEQSSDVEPEEEPDGHRNSSLFGKDGTQWFKHPPPARKTRSANVIKEKPGVTGVARNAKTILLVENTNKYITQIHGQFRRERSCRPTDTIEMKALLGLLYLAGTLRAARLNVAELWYRSGTGIERFWLTMSQQRFLFLLRTLRFDDKETREERKSTDRLAAIRDFFELFNSNCKKYYTVGDCVTIDEKLEAFRGRCIFKQYIPNKPNKYGLKIYAVVDSHCRYTLNLEVYPGQQPEGAFRLPNDPTSFVKRLISPISGSGRNVTADNWFTSFPLVSQLLNEHRLTYVGTVRKNKRELPPEFVNTKDRPVNSSMFGFSKDMTIVSYVPKKGKNVVLTSSMHHSDDIDMNTGKQMKPEMITYYNSTKGGVDTVDELCATYNVARNTRRWPMVIFYSLLNLAGINAQIIFTSNNKGQEGETIRRLFLKRLSLSLTEEHTRRRVLEKNVPRAVRERREEAAGLTRDHQEAEVIPQGTKRRCYFCKKDRKTKYYCLSCHKFVCIEHAQFMCSNCVQ